MNNIFKNDFEPWIEINSSDFKKLPKSIQNICKENYLGTILNGYIKIINPKDYLNFVDENMTPILVTAFCDIIAINQEGYIELIQTAKGFSQIIAKKIDHFIKNLFDNEFQNEYFNLSFYNDAIEKFGKPEYDECFAFVPLLELGGNESIDNIEKAKSVSYLNLIFKK